LTSELLTEFLQSRSDGTSEHTLKFYHRCLKRFIGHEFTPEDINDFLHNLNCGNAKHSYYRAIRALCNWLQGQRYITDNPMAGVDAPKVARRLLPAVTPEQMQTLMDAADNLRDRAIISLLFDSGLRLSEVASIRTSDIDWSSNTLRVVVKGNREAKAVFTDRTASLLREYLSGNGHTPTLFGVKAGAVQDTLRRLSEVVGFQCNAHAFRRGFACNLHKRGLPTLTIMHLGRWSSLEMVASTRSLTFDDCLKHYRAVLN